MTEFESFVSIAYVRTKSYMGYLEIFLRAIPTAVIVWLFGFFFQRRGVYRVTAPKWLRRVCMVSAHIYSVDKYACALQLAAYSMPFFRILDHALKINPPNVIFMFGIVIVLIGIPFVMSKK